ncbi:MAG TPA: fused MFS/spermidine synthase [Candidatus Saccharimonadales bacterium]|nr:fused MFS/spermidine synthase [Candidatus Saccharimonadales bacterium]
MARDAVLFDGNTDLNHFQVVDTTYNGRPARVLYSGNKMAAQSGIAFDNKPELLFDYNERLMEFIRGARPKSILVLGGGGFTLPTAARKAFPELSIDVVELDPGLVGIAQQYFSFQPDQNLRVYVQDGLSFIKTSTQTYDLVVVDVFHDAVMPPNFQTPQVVKDLKQRTGAHGVLAINAIGALRGERSQILRRLVDMLQAEYSKVAIFPGEYGLSPWMVQNFVIMAQDGRTDVASYLRYPPVELADG